MLIDVIAVMFFALALFKGIRKGFIVAIFSLLGFVIGLAAALKLSSVVAEYLGTSTSISGRLLPFVAFLIVFVAVALLIRIGAKMIEGAVKLAMLGWLNRTAGLLLFLFIYFFIFSIILFYAVQLNLLKPSATQASLAYPFIQPIAPKMMLVLGSIFPFLKGIFSELLHFFQNISDYHQA